MTSSRDERLVREALLRPHGSKERLDPDFVVTHRCERCGKLGMGPRKHLQEAILEHQVRCPVRPNQSEAITRLFYPRSS